MKSSRRTPLALVTLCLLVALPCLAAGAIGVQNGEIGVQNDVEAQIARIGIEGEEIPVPASS